MASKDDMALASTSKFFNPFDERDARLKVDTSASNKTTLSESKSADELEFMTFIDTFGSPLSCHVIRLQSGQEFRRALIDLTMKKKLKAPFVMSCVGSARSAKLRLANATAEETNYLLDLQGPLEIISVSGTFAIDGQCHLHASLANASGKVHGGHLIEMIVHTTAEVVLGECTAMIFERVFDRRTGFKELSIKER